MPSFNRVILIGHLGKDPEIRATQSGDRVASFSIATSEKWKSKDGQKQERTDWHRCEAWGKVVDVIEQYVHKGDPICVEGSIRYEEWEKDGQKRTATKIRVSGVQLLGSRGEGGGSGGGRDAGGSQGGGDEAWGD